MIVSFSVVNYRSFSSEETLSLVASKRLNSSHPEHCVPLQETDESVLRTAVLYGANGAGKSNLFRALQFLKRRALGSRKKGTGTGRVPFRFKPDLAENPSEFDIQFLAGDKLFRFGLKMDDQKILEEWLIELQGNRERIIYERSIDSEGRVFIEAPGLKTASEKLKALVTVGGPENQSFLATVHVTLNASDWGNDLDAAIHWFKHSLALIGPEDSVAPVGHMISEDPKFLEFAGEFLRASSTGVDGLLLTKTEMSERDLHKVLPESVVSEVLKDIKESEEGVAVVELDKGEELLFERKQGSHIYSIRIQASHRQKEGEPVALELADESDGTRRLLSLIPALHELHSSNRVFVVDEIDRSLHPILIVEYLRFFLKSCPGGRSQLVLTTHESNLLDLELLRRDEIWFAEKDPSGSTRLYSLAEYKIRKDLELRKHYLQGRFGAIPFLAGLEKLSSEEACAE